MIPPIEEVIRIREGSSGVAERECGGTILSETSQALASGSNDIH